VLINKVACHLIHLRKTERTVSGLQHVKCLDSSLDRRSSCPWKQCIRLVTLRALDGPAIISLLSRHSSRMELPQFQLRAHPRSIGSSVQHVCASGQHRRYEHLPRGRPTVLHPRQQDSAGYLLLQHRPILLGEILLRHEEQAERRSLVQAYW
jgi:hypothetical protein